MKLNSAAIPFDLLESDLLGYQKGAFTGAIAQKISRFEMADKGTLFLDEVSDIPPALSSNCYTFCKNRSSNDWEAVEATKWMSDWSRQPIGISPEW